MHNCLVCRHPEILAIDRALLGGGGTLEVLSTRYGLSISSLFRHRKWLRQKMRQTEARYRQQQQQETLFVYNELLEASRRALRTAQAEDNTRQVLQAVRESGRILNFINKLDAPPDQDTIHRLFTTPQYLSRESFLPTDRQFITDCRQSLADGLGFPCPDLPVSPVEAAWDELAAESEDKAKCACLNAARPEPGQVNSARLQELLSRLDLDPNPDPKTPSRPKLHGGRDPQGGDSQSQALPPIPDPATTPRTKREKSAKSPPKSRPINKKQLLIQLDNHDQKTSAKKCQIKPPNAPAVAHSAPASSLETPNPQLETKNSELETPQESLFTRLRRKWAKPKPTPALDTSRDSEALYQQHLEDMAVAGVDLSVGRDPQDGDSQSEAPPAIPVETAAPSSSQPNPLPEDGNPPLITSPGPPSPVPGPSPAPGPSCSGLPSPVPGPIPPSPAAPYVYTPEEEAILFPKLDPTPPDPNKPLNPFTHPGDYWFAVAHGYRRDNPPKHIPYRHWEDDYGNPRRF